MGTTKVRNYEQILSSPMQKNDAEAATVRDYLHTLLITLWNEGEGFSGKRPFGNSGWEFEIYYALAKGGFVSGRIDLEYGDLEDVDEAAANQMVFDLINYVFFYETK